MTLILKDILADASLLTLLSAEQRTDDLELECERLEKHLI